MLKQTGMSLPGLSSFADTFKFLEFTPFLLMFYKEVYSLGPRQFILYGLESTWKSLENGISLYYTSRLIDSVSLVSFLLSLST